MSSRNNRLNSGRTRDRRPAGSFAVLTMYGAAGQVECIAVAIQDRGVKQGGRMLDSRLFWSRDYASGEELMEAVVDWFCEKGAVEVRQIDDLLPLEECDGRFIRLLD